MPNEQDHLAYEMTGLVNGRGQWKLSTLSLARLLGCFLQIP